MYVRVYAYISRVLLTLQGGRRNIHPTDVRLEVLEPREKEKWGTHLLLES